MGAEFLEEMGGLASGNFLGLLNVLIGRRIERADGTLVSAGLTWRELSVLLKKARWEPEAIRELGLKPEDLPARDRQRLWYSAIALADVDSAKATDAGDRLAEKLRSAGFQVGSAPHKSENA